MESRLSLRNIQAWRQRDDSRRELGGWSAAMDQTTLVNRDLNAGARVMEALSRTKIPITLCKWVYLPELEEWHLVVASPWYDTKGALKTYGAVSDALERAGIY